MTECLKHSDSSSSTITHTSQLHRKLGNRQIQLIAIGGSIGTAVFISIGTGLAHGGPGSLFLAYTLYSVMVGLVNNCMAEMAVQHPVSGAFIRMAGHWVDEAFGFMVGWNFFLYEALGVPFEVPASNIVLKFWRDDIPVAAVVAACIVLSEFGSRSERLSSSSSYSSSPSPQWSAGFLGSLWIAAFACVGREYVSMIAGEAKSPRVYLKNAFKTTYIRFGIFFILSSLRVDIILPYNDPTLVGIVNGVDGAGTGAASPYAIAMGNLGIGVLYHVVNGLPVSSIFSSGQAPKFLLKCTSLGLPVYCLGIVMPFPFPTFLAVSNDSAVVLTWLTNVITAAEIIDHIVISITSIFFYRACKAQGIDRPTPPYCGWFQPYSAYISATFSTCVVYYYEYSTFLPGNFTISGFFTCYTMVLVAPITFFG
ncbi:amino acid permease/ SLC12A domain-containing protein [Fusarium oxysporum f. sp. albedinis]|nr:amino acid permease/ SLC12A domain-containing protein [Fusarium oxysporum f. sp. albedinis]